MDCSTCVARLEEFSLVDDSETTLPVELRNHLDSCDSCRAHLLESRNAWLLLAAALEKPSLHTNLEERVFSRIERMPIDLANGETKTFVFWKYALAATVLLALLAATVLGPRWFRSFGLKSERELARVKEFARQMDKLDQLEQAFSSPGFRYVSLKTANSNSDVQGYLVYDRISNEGHFFAYDLGAKDATFMLWLLQANEAVVSAAKIEVNSEGVGAAVIQIPPDISTIAEVVVTQETSPNAKTPSLNISMRSPFGG